jgi:hypothetical protein
MRHGDFVQWFEALEKRHLANLSFSEVRRAIQALSSLYVERRGGRLGGGSALDGAGKRAAFALFFGPLHFLLVREIIRELQARVPKKAGILDIGCGTGVAGAAWAVAMDHRPRTIGVDRNSWVLQECRWTYQQFGIPGVTRSSDLNTLQIPAETAVIAAFTINELASGARDRFHDQFLRAARMGMPVLVIEPIARSLTSWWDDWARDWIAAGGREDTWRFRIELPERLALMDRAAGLDHRELTGRSLWLSGKP